MFDVQNTFSLVWGRFYVQIFEDNGVMLGFNPQLNPRKETFGPLYRLGPSGIGFSVNK